MPIAEKSKLFIKAGNLDGIKAERETQRGIIAKRFIPKLERFENAEFVKSCPQIKFNDLKVNDGERSFYL